MPTISKNQQAIASFAKSFDPPLNVARTENFGGKPLVDGYITAFHDDNLGIGITAIAWGKGSLKAFIEIVGHRDEAMEVGEFFADSISEYRARLGDGEVGQVNQHFTAGHDRGIPAPNPSPDSQPASPAPGNEPSSYYPSQNSETAAVATPLPASPNPAFVDMMGLDPATRVSLLQEFPELRFSMSKDRKRMRIGANGEVTPDDRAGYASADQVAHVVRLRQPVTGLTQAQKLDDLAGQLPCVDNGGHAWRNGSCWKCGTRQPKDAVPEPNADAEHRASLDKLIAALPDGPEKQAAAVERDRLAALLDEATKGIHTGDAD